MKPWHMREKVTLGLLLGTTFVAADGATAQALFGNSYNSYGYGGPDPSIVLALTRAAAMGASTAIGFSIGWALSPQAAHLRKFLAAVLGVGAVGVAVFNNGVFGWSMTTLLSIVGFCGAMGYWLGKWFKGLGNAPTTFGSAEWADAEEIAAKGLFEKVGLRLGQVFDGKAWKKIYYGGDRHALIVAPNRSGKGATQIIANLLTYSGSTLVIDPKGENAMMTALARQEMGQSVLKVDPWGIAPIDGIETARFNPLDMLLQGDADISEIAMLIADALVAERNAKDPFWDQMSLGFLQGLVLYVATDEREAGQRHLGRVRDLTLMDGDNLKALFNRMLDSPYHLVASTGSRMLQMEDKLLANVLASVQSHTQFLDSPRIRESLSTSDFRFEDLKAAKTTIYLILPADRLQAFAPWLRLLIQCAITVNARNIAEKPDQPVLFMLDEMAALGRLSMVEQAYGLMAGFGIQLYGVVQDLGQLKRIYGDSWETFIGNSGVIQYFGSRDRASAEYFSALCGDTTVWNFSTAISRTFGSGSGGGSSHSKGSTDTTAAAHRKLAYPDELMRLREDRQIVFIENMNPIIAKKVPWFLDEELKDKGVSLQ